MSATKLYQSIYNVFLNSDHVQMRASQRSEVQAEGEWSDESAESKKKTRASL